MSYKNFNKDLPYGQKYEDRLRPILERVGCEYKGSNDTKTHDKTYLLDGIELRFECKSDKRSNTTKNIAIEAECRGKPSGITTTKSDFWAHFYRKDNELYLLIISSRILRAEICTGKYGNRIGGDGTDTGSYPKNYLIPKKIVEEWLLKYPNNCCILPPSYLKNYEQL
jgi:hypothetical protein